MEEEIYVNYPKKQGFFYFFFKKGLWVNALLFFLTIFSTFSVGLTWSVSFIYSDVISQNPNFTVGYDILTDPKIINLSIIYMVVLLTILMSHELGHFLTCRYYRIDATLPYFIPAPTLIGTMGAFIKIKSPITRKKQLFDIGVAGPLAGFVLSLPALIYGLSLSKAVPSLPIEGSLVFGEPILLKMISGVVFKNVPGNYDIILHPVAFAGWVGILVTSFNLFPIGQLDGGHVIYALLGQRSKSLARFILVIFIVMGIFFWVGWFVWAVLISFLGLKHPRIIDEVIPLSQGRKVIGIVVFIIFILSFIPDPVKGYNMFDLIKSLHF